MAQLRQQLFHVRIVLALGDDVELVAAHAEHRRVGENAADDAAGLLQILVARRMALGVVDLLEVVDVQRHHGELHLFRLLMDPAVQLRLHVHIGVLVAHAGQRVHVGLRPRRVQHPLVLLVPPHLRVHVDDTDDELRAVLLLDHGGLGGDIGRHPVDHHAVAQHKDAVFPDLPQDILLCEQGLEAQDIVRMDALHGFLSGPGEEILPHGLRAKGLIVAGGAVLHIVIRHRVDGVNGEEIAGQSADAGIGDELLLGPLHGVLIAHLGVHVADADDDVAVIVLHPGDLHIGIPRLAVIELPIGDRISPMLVQGPEDDVPLEALQEHDLVVAVDQRLRLLAADVEEILAPPLDGQGVVVGVAAVFDEVVGLQINVVEVIVVRRQRLGDVGIGDGAAPRLFIGDAVGLRLRLLGASLGLQGLLAAGTDIRRHLLNGVRQSLYLVVAADVRRDILERQRVLGLPALGSEVLGAAHQGGQRLGHVPVQPGVHGDRKQRGDHGDDADAVQQHPGQRAAHLVDGLVGTDEGDGLAVAGTHGLHRRIEGAPIRALLKEADILIVPKGAIPVQLGLRIGVREFQKRHILLTGGKLLPAGGRYEIIHKALAGLAGDDDIEVGQAQIVHHAVQEFLVGVIGLRGLAGFQAAAHIVRVRMVFHIGDDLRQAVLVLTVDQSAEEEVEDRHQQHAEAQHKQHAGPLYLAAQRRFRGDVI